MEHLRDLAQLLIALGIANVWLLRFGRPTSYRGGEAQNMREEFEAYGLPHWFMLLIGLCKLALAGLLIYGFWNPEVTQPAAYGMAGLMAGAIAMHAKVCDPFVRWLPATAMLALSLFVALT